MIFRVSPNANGVSNQFIILNVWVIDSMVTDNLFTNATIQKYLCPQSIVACHSKFSKLVANCSVWISWKKTSIHNLQGTATDKSLYAGLSHEFAIIL
jgi:hypothetical protein